MFHKSKSRSQHFHVDDLLPRYIFHWTFTCYEILDISGHISTEIYDNFIINKYNIYRAHYIITKITLSASHLKNKVKNTKIHKT